MTAGHITFCSIQLLRRPRENKESNVEEIVFIVTLGYCMDEICCQLMEKLPQRCYIPRVRFSLKERLLYTLNKICVTQV